MGLFDLFKKEKSEVEKYYEERRKTYRPTPNLNQNMDQNMNQNANGISFRFTVQDVFTITGRGTVIVGRVECGMISVGETVTLQRKNGENRQVVITGIEAFRKVKNTAAEGENVGILLRGLSKSDIGAGDILAK